MALSAKTRTADCSLGDVEIAVWLFCTQKVAGSFRAAQALIASCHSPRDVVPSPTKEMATRESGVGGRESEPVAGESFSDSRLPIPDSHDIANAIPAIVTAGEPRG